jgi:hypothetical protein
MFDKGVFVIGDDFNLIGIQGKIQTHTDHPISNEFIQYHRSVFSDDLLDKKSK